MLARRKQFAACPLQGLLRTLLTHSQTRCGGLQRLDHVKMPVLLLEIRPALDAEADAYHCYFVVVEQCANLITRPDIVTTLHTFGVRIQ